jgi:lysophospholipase L1-like esterase
MKVIVLFLISTLLVTSCHAGSPKLQPLAPDAVALAFGDSLTFGTGASPEESYPAVLQGLIGRKVINAGVPGETTAEGRVRLAGLLDSHRPALLLLCLGANDMIRRMDEKDAAENLGVMIRMARERDIQVVLLGVPRPALFGSPPEFFRNVAEEFSVPYLKDAMEDTLKEPELRSDPIHPNARGYRKIAEDVAAFLRKKGAL